MTIKEESDLCVNYAELRNDLVVWGVYIDNELYELFTTLKNAQANMRSYFCSHSIEIRKTIVKGDITDD